MAGDEVEKKRLEEIAQKRRALQEEKERLASQQCSTCVHFILYKDQFYVGEWGYCDAHDRNVRRTQPHYPWCKYEVRP